ncbi:MAG: ribosome-recycling factor [Parcubacteria group bacterium]|nr:ribosome-recycling factor [Parcubacteria group bacterium]
MTYQEILDNLKPELEKTKEDAKQELMKLRSGRLSPALIEDIHADCFGAMLPLKQLGAISNLSPRELSLQLWDKSYVEGVVKAIEIAGLSLSVRIDGENIFLTAPPLTTESREDLIVVLNKKKEEIFQQLRHKRDKSWRAIQDGFQAGEIREDDKFKGKDKLDESVREFRDKIEEMVKDKETEIRGQ